MLEERIPIPLHLLQALLLPPQCLELPFGRLPSILQEGQLIVQFIVRYASLGCEAQEPAPLLIRLRELLQPVFRLGLGVASQGVAL